VIAYTSGTTGRPKGAVVTGSTGVTAMRAGGWIARLPLFCSRLFTANMSFVASALAGIFPVLYVRGSVGVLADADVDEVVALTEQRGLSCIGLPSPWAARFIELVEQRPDRVRSICSVVHGGSRLKPAEAEQLARLLGDRFILSWGMTENCGLPLAATSPGDWDAGDARVFASVGRAVPGSALRVVDEGGAQLARDGQAVGELLLQSSTLFDGYFRCPEATDAAFLDGWFRTGDMGAIGDDGLVTLVDRRTDLIVSGGMNISPSEVESVLAEMPGIDQVVVVGVPHDRWGRTPVAVIVPAGPRAPTEAEVIAYCREHLAGYKKPTRVLFVDALPRNASGKVGRQAVADSITQAR